jgi:glycosyltransferase involved in cell wall biosynthesis
MTPRISVILPTFNRQAVLPRAINSVLAQNEPAFELIVVDDGSTDGTPALLAGIADPRLRVLRNAPNRGGNYARNRGIEIAQAPIVCFLDSDDEYFPGKARRVLEFFDNHPGINGLLDSYELVRDGSAEPPRERLNPTDLDSRNFRRGIFQGRLSKPTPAISARKQALIDAGMFDETLRRRQDMDLLLRLSRQHACASISDVLWRKHWVAGAISADRGNFVEALLAIVDRHPEYLGNPEYRIGLERDVARHFAELAAEFQIKAIYRDIVRLRRDGRITMPGLGHWRRGMRIFWRAVVATRQR